MFQKSGGSGVKNLPAKSGDGSLILGSGRPPREGNGNPLQDSCLENPMNRGALVSFDYSLICLYTRTSIIFWQADICVVWITEWSLNYVIWQDLGPSFSSSGIFCLSAWTGMKWRDDSHSVMSSSVTPSTVAHQTPVSIDFSRWEYWNGLPFPSPGDLPDPGIEPSSPELQADSLSSEPPGRPLPK